MKLTKSYYLDRDKVLMDQLTDEYNHVLKEGVEGNEFRLEYIKNRLQKYTDSYNQRLNTVPTPITVPERKFKKIIVQFQHHIGQTLVLWHYQGVAVCKLEDKDSLDGWSTHYYLVSTHTGVVLTRPIVKRKTAVAMCEELVQRFPAINNEEVDNVKELTTLINELDLKYQPQFHISY